MELTLWLRWRKRLKWRNVAAWLDSILHLDSLVVIGACLSSTVKRTEYSATPFLPAGRQTSCSECCCPHRQRLRPRYHLHTELHWLGVPEQNWSRSDVYRLFLSWCTLVYLVKCLGTSSTTAHQSLTSKWDSIFAPSVAVFLSYRVIDSVVL